MSIEHSQKIRTNSNGQPATCLVTGATGQLGQALQFIQPKHSDIQFIFASSTDLDITNEEKVTSFFIVYYFRFRSKHLAL